jgi:hypothetical protein
MPKGVGLLRVRIFAVMGRGSPTASPHPSDDEESITEDPESVVVDGINEFSEQI